MRIILLWETGISFQEHGLLEEGAMPGEREYYIDDLIVDDFCANVARKIQSAKKDDNNHEKEDRFL